VIETPMADGTVLQEGEQVPEDTRQR